MSLPAPDIQLPPDLARELEEADALDEIAVVYDPVPEVLEAYAFEGRVGVIAVVSGDAQDRIAALEAGALEALSPEMAEDEARVRLQTAVARFRSRLQLELTRDVLNRQADSNERNLRLAAQLQRSLLPREMPQVPGLTFSTAYLPQEFVSGDTYEVRQLTPDHVAIYTLDAVGHGVRAALLTTLLRSVFRPLDGGMPRSPHDVLRDLNHWLLEAQFEDSPTAAFCYGVLTVSTRRLQLANAGHPLPARVSSDGVLDRLGGSGLLLGVDPATHSTEEVQLRPGDRVVFYTDGADPAYDDSFSEQLRLHRNLSLEDQVGGALGAVIELDDEGRPEDDITAVAFAIGGE